MTHGFVQPDSIVPDQFNPQSLNRYSYVQNNPIRYNDPTGHVHCEGDENYDDGPMCLKNPNSRLSIEVRNTEYQNECASGKRTECPGGAVGGAVFLVESVVAAGSLEYFVLEGGLADTVSSLSQGLKLWWKGLGNSGEETSTQLARRLGQSGETSSGIIKNTQRIPSSTGAAYRIPDQLLTDQRLISEVKNVSQLSLTAQLRDFLSFAQENGYTFELWTRVDTVISGPLQVLIDDGSIIQRFIGQ